MRLPRIAAIALITTAVGGHWAFTQAATSTIEMKASATKAFVTAQNAGAEKISPRSFSEGSDVFNGALKMTEKDKSDEKVIREFAKAQEKFNESTRFVKKAKETFPSAFAAREAALEADAMNHSAIEWKAAQERFENACATLEKGNTSSAMKDAANAEAGFKAAELKAIKDVYLDQARILIERADKEQVERFAPKTLTIAKETLSLAEKQLNSNRYDAAVPIALATDAKRAAAHAITLSQVIAANKEKE